MSTIDDGMRSGVRSIDLFGVVVYRRRELAARGFEDGRWSYSMVLAAEEMALQHEMPTSDEGWCAMLEELDGAMSDAVIQACAPVSYKTGGVD